MAGAYVSVGYPVKRIMTSSETSHIPTTANMAVTKNLVILDTSYIVRKEGCLCPKSRCLLYAPATNIISCINN